MQRFVRHVRWSVAPLIAATVVAACGSSSGGSATSSGTSGSATSSGTSGSTGGASASSSSSTTTRSFKGTIKVAVISDLTGPSSIGAGTQGILAMFDSVNASGGIDGYKIVPTEYDTASDPATAVQAVRHAIAAKPAAVVSGSFSIGSGLPTLAASGIPAIGDGGASGWIGHGSLFSIVGDQTVHTSDTSLLIAKKYAGATKIALIGSSYSSLAQKALEADASKVGVQIVLKDVGLPIAPTSAEFLSAAEQMKSDGAQAVIDSGSEGLSELQIDLNQLGTKAKVVTNDEYSTPSPRENGLIFTDAWANPYVTDDPGIEAYKAAMQKFGYGSLVKTNVWTPLRWAEADLLVTALKTAGPPFSNAAVVKALSETKNFTAGGVVPPASYPQLQQTGDHCQAVMEVEGTKWVSLINGSNPFICGAPSQALKSS